jgi:hypothetical protein
VLESSLVTAEALGGEAAGDGERLAAATVASQTIKFECKLSEKKKQQRSAEGSSGAKGESPDSTEAAPKGELGRKMTGETVEDRHTAGCRVGIKNAHGITAKGVCGFDSHSKKEVLPNS